MAQARRTLYLEAQDMATSALSGLSSPREQGPRLSLCHNPSTKGSPAHSRCSVNVQGETAESANETQTPDVWIQPDFAQLVLVSDVLQRLV